MMPRFWSCLAALSGFTAVAMGAVAAHVIEDAHLAALAEKASIYQLMHAVLLLALAGKTGRFFAAARWIVLAGLVCFCGSIYLHALGVIPSAALAPAGGMALMLGWLLIAVAAWCEV